MNEIAARVIAHDETYDQTTVETTTGHQLQCGGREGDGYCYGHQSFDCLGGLSAAEQAAIETAWSVHFSGGGGR